MSDKSCKQFFVSGRVQGVFFRAATAAKARELTLTGHARNLADGRVEVLACGEPAAVDALAEWLWEGSPYSRVSDVVASSVSDQPGLVIPISFSTR